MGTAKETDFCARLRTWAEGMGFVVYPEVDGWDLVLVAEDAPVSIGGRTSWPSNEDRDLVCGVGEQVGIHAKLRPSFEVLAQAIEGHHRTPRFALVAVPKRTSDAFRTIAGRLNIGVIEEQDEFRLRGSCRPRVGQPLTLPEFASRAIEAGAPSPRSLSAWRLKALRFLAWARQQPDGQLTALDVERFGIHRGFADRWMHRADFVYRDTAKGGVRKVQAYRLRTEPSALPDFGYEGVAKELAAHDATRAA